MKDLYVYPNTNVLINKLNIKNQKELDEAENALVSLNITHLISNPINIRSVFDIKIIHKLLFSDLYDWAGENRKMNMYKEEPILNGLSVEYSDYHKIENDLKLLDKEFNKIKYEHLKKKEIVNWIVLLISKLWKIHCFREGNTRSTTVFLYLFLKQVNLKVNVDFIGKHAKFFRNALVLGSINEYSEYKHLTNILMDSISLKTITEEKYKTIRQYEVDKYEYRAHQYKE